ncbi:MAG: ATP-binding protein [Sciscionella sp.]
MRENLEPSWGQDRTAPDGEQRLESGMFEVTLEVPATGQGVAVARAVAFDIGMRTDFGVETLEDLKIAVDEACSELVVLSVPEATVRCLFQVAGSRLRVVLTTASATPATPPRSTFGWHVLSVVSDEVWANDPAEASAGPDGRYPVTIGLVKNRRMTAADQ